MASQPLPRVIQGGMGAGVSGWSLANAVSKAGQLGVVAGTGIDLILARRLQLGDPGGHMRRALANLPLPGVAQRVLERYFVPGGKAPDARFKPKPLPSLKPPRHLTELVVASNFAEVFLAREGHDNPVGINFLEKIQLPTLPSIFGAMLAGVGFVLMGAGIPTAIPGILDDLAEGKPVELRIDAQGAAPGQKFYSRFDPSSFYEGEAPPLARPRFLSIISSSAMAKIMVKKSSGTVDGFIVEGHTAGGHNAPPRRRNGLSASGEPIYGDRDVPDLEAIAALGLPFWLAGDYAGPRRLQQALDAGAAGVQVGTAFAHCAESGIAAELKARVLAQSRAGTAHVHTDALASPTGFPFKVVQLDDTMSEEEPYKVRQRVCDLGYLRHAYVKEDGELGWRCPAEPLAEYLRKGGAVEDTVGRKCVCNGLMANIELGQIQKDGYRELPMVTSGDDAAGVARFLRNGAETYDAADVLAHLLS